jgi:CRISPR-associated protein Cst2
MWIGVKKMDKVAQISILGKISGNVNADEVIGERVTLKKMYSSSGEVLPFVSARAIKFAIRQAFKNEGFEVDPFIINPEAEGTLKATDSGRPDKYIDNDLFGYMCPVGREKRALKRQAPIAISYFKALRDTPIKAEFAARFPRPWGAEGNPVPFEVEVAEFIGRINCIIYDYIGNFRKDREIVKNIGEGRKEIKDFLKNVPEELNPQEKENRIKTFLKIFLTPTYVLPKRTNSLCIPEYIAALVVLSRNGPLPVFQYLDYDFEKGEVNTKKLKKIIEREEISKSGPQIFLIDYLGKIEELPQGISKSSVTEVINKIATHLLKNEGV